MFEKIKNFFKKKKLTDFEKELLYTIQVISKATLNFLLKTAMNEETDLPKKDKNKKQNEEINILIVNISNIMEVLKEVVKEKEIIVKEEDLKSLSIHEKWLKKIDNQEALLKEATEKKDENGRPIDRMFI